MNNPIKKIIYYDQVVDKNKELETNNTGLLTALSEKTDHWEQAINRNKELEADVAGLLAALNEKTSHWEEAVNRNRELETELTWLHKGNRGLMEELQFLKSKNKELSDFHDEVVLKNWQGKNKKDIMCINPFTKVSIQENGDVYTCCPAYLKPFFTIGNVYETASFDEIWNSENAKKLRYSVTEGNFEFCTKYCVALNQRNISNRMGGGGVTTRDFDKYSFSKYQDCYLSVYPVNIALCIDDTCNLSCRSCRSHIKINNKEKNEKLINMLEKIVRPVLKNCEHLALLGNGEFFASKPVQDFCKTLAKDEFPNLKIIINTNAQLLTSEKWKEFDNLKGILKGISVSVDAAEKQTYELIRTGSKWEKLQDAFAIISNMKQNNEIELFMLRFVVQKLNYRQIPDFISMAKQIKANTIQFQRIVNLGVFNEEEFFDIDVMNPKNDNYEEAKYFIEGALQEQDITILQNCLDYSCDIIED